MDKPNDSSMTDTFQIPSDNGPRDIDIYSEEGFRVLSKLWTRSGWNRRVTYEVTWLGVPIIQLPEDIMMMQELMFKLRPNIVVETGTAHGGSAILYASILDLLGRGSVVSIDVEIRKYNRLAIQAHPMSKHVSLIEGSSLDRSVVDDVRGRIGPQDTVLVALDSNHTQAHVRQELELYSGLVTPGSYIVVFDTVLETLRDAPDFKPEWNAGTPAAAITEFLVDHKEFSVDPYYNRLGVTYCLDGFLRRKED
jgi:cephalosporin hydroxylase